MNKIYVYAAVHRLCHCYQYTHIIIITTLPICVLTIMIIIIIARRVLMMPWRAISDSPTQRPCSIWTILWPCWRTERQPYDILATVSNVCFDTIRACGDAVIPILFHANRDQTHSSHIYASLSIRFTHRPPPSPSHIVLFMVNCSANTFDFVAFGGGTNKFEFAPLTII